MREKLVKRFWCDHCNKAGLSKFHMRHHQEAMREAYYGNCIGFYS